MQEGRGSHCGFKSESSKLGRWELAEQSNILLEGGVPLLEGEVAAGLGECLVACNSLDGVDQPGISLDEERVVVQNQFHMDRAKAFADGEQHREGSDALTSVPGMDQRDGAAGVVDAQVKGVVLCKRMVHVDRQDIRGMGGQMMLHSIGLDSDSCAAKILKGFYQGTEEDGLVSPDEGSGKVTEEDLIAKALEVDEEGPLEFRSNSDICRALTNEHPVFEVVIISDNGATGLWLTSWRGAPVDQILRRSAG